MLFLDATTKSLEVILAGAVATTQLPFVAGYADIERTTYGLSGAGENDGTTNSATAVTLVAAPAATTTRKLNFLSIFNGDTAAATVTVRLNVSGTFRTIWKGTLAIGDTLIFVDGRGFYVTDAAGQIKSGGSTGVISMASGGTGAALSPVHGGIVYSTASVLALSAAGSAGQLLRSGGAGAPTWSTTTFPATFAAGDVLYSNGANVVAGLAIGSAGKFLRSDGTAPTWATTTIPDTIAQYSLLYASPANVLAATSAATIPLRLTTTGLRLGAETPKSSVLMGKAPELTIETAATYAGIVARAYSTTSSAGGALVLGRSNSASLGTLTETTTGQVFGFIGFEGVNSSSTISYPVYISAYQDGAGGATHSPGRLQFFLGTSAAAPTERMRLDSSGNLSVGYAASAAARLHSLATTEQLRLGYDAANYAAFTVSAGGDLTLAPSGADTSVTGTLACSSRLAVGSAVNAAAALSVTALNSLTGTSQYGLFADQLSFSSAATTGGVGLYLITRVQDASFTLATLYGGYIGAVKGAQATVLTNYGLSIQSLVGGTTNYGLAISSQTSATTNYSIYTGSGLVRLGDETQIVTGAVGLKVGGTAARGTTAGTNALHVFNGTAPVGTLTNGISIYSVGGQPRIMDSTGAVSELGSTATFPGTLGIVGALTTNGGLVTFGANDSAGAGFRLMRVPNV